MRNYNKKLIIMFVMLLAVIGFGTIQNVTTANAATVGQQLLTPENGWQRFSATDTNFKYSFEPKWYESGAFSDGTNKLLAVSFNFKGTKLRVIGHSGNNRSADISCIIDGVEEKFSQVSSGYITNGLNYNKENLANQEHSVIIKTNVPGAYTGLTLKAIDIDSTGQLIPYSKQIESISLNKSSMDLIVGDSEQLTATTTPASVEIVWSSSDINIATVDENGNVKGIAAGTATITAQIKGSETKATCVVNVTKEIIDDPQPPTEPTGDGTLFIELVDGNIKQYDVTTDQIDKFMQWFKDRDNNDSELPFYKFTKGDYKDYVVHDKIVWFEVR